MAGPPKVLVALGVPVLAIAVAAFVMTRPDEENLAAASAVLPVGQVAPSAPAFSSYELAKSGLTEVVRLLDAPDALLTRASVDAIATGAARDVLTGAGPGVLRAHAFDDPARSLHEIELIDLSARRSGDRVEGSATWRALSLADQQGHAHVKGGAFASDFVLDWDGKRWRYSAFTIAPSKDAQP